MLERSMATDLIIEVNIDHRFLYVAPHQVTLLQEAFHATEIGSQARNNLQD